MREAIFYGVMLFCSAYGLFSLIFFLRDFWGEKKYLRGKCIYTLITVEEQDLYAEEMIRALVFQNYKNDTGICDRKILVIPEEESGCNAKRIQRIFERETDVFILGKQELFQLLSNG